MKNNIVVDEEMLSISRGNEAVNNKNNDIVKTLSDLVIFGNIKNKKFIFPNSVKKIRFDLGLSTNAPHSCDWLMNNVDVGVVGIEANPICQKSLIFCDTDNSHVESMFLIKDKICKFSGYVSEVYLKKHIFGIELEQGDNAFSMPPIETFKAMGKTFHISPRAVYGPGNNFRLNPLAEEVADIGGRFILIGGAVDNISEINMFVEQEFYSSYPALGCSSLVKGMIEANERPAGNVSEQKNHVNKTFQVESFSLDTVLEHVDWQRFSYVESIKIDVEGKDLEVLKSCKKHMDKVVYFRAEAYDDESIIYGIKKRDMVKYMHANNFELIDEEDGDYGFINKKYKNLAQKQGLTYR